MNDLNNKSSTQSGAHQQSQSGVNRLVIIDGNAIIHRAYHAIPPLTDLEGNVVNAVYGFTTMMLRIFHDLNPEYIVVTFDRPAPTFRKAMFKEYQAHRPKMDDELIPQIEKVHEVVRAMGIPIFEMDGFEADDVIGTLVERVFDKRQSETQDEREISSINQVIIVTGDRDILQLVEEEKVYVYMPTKGLSESKLYGEKETIERMGVTPKQIPDFKALAGDASDNYPGVSGIGPKTAVGLLNQFHSVDELYEFIHKYQGVSIKKQGKEEISEKIIQKLIEGEADAKMSHLLATIKQDVPIEIELKKINSIDTPEVRDVINRLGFKSIVTRMDKLKSENSSQNIESTMKNTPKSQESEQQSLF
jgi:DNA polymerase I